MAASLSEISAIVRHVLHAPEIELSAATSFDDLPFWDSMYLISIVVETECRCRVQFDPPDIDRLSTLGDLLHLVEAKRAPAPV